MRNRAVRLIQRRGGFTLVELIVVMVILVLLAGTVTVVVVNRIEDGKRTKARVDVAGLEQAVDLYYLDAGNYPTSQQGLEALLNEPTSPPIPAKWNGPYIKKSLPVEPWGSDYIYEYPGTNNPDSFDIFSMGKDQAVGGTGNDMDIGNWHETN